MTEGWRKRFTYNRRNIFYFPGHFFLICCLLYCLAFVMKCFVSKFIIQRAFNNKFALLYGKILIFNWCPGRIEHRAIIFYLKDILHCIRVNFIIKTMILYAIIIDQAEITSTEILDIFILQFFYFISHCIKQCSFNIFYFNKLVIVLLECSMLISVFI